MPKQCDMLEWPEELKEDCQEIVKEIHKELESCQPLTVVGVALFMINNRINTEQIPYSLRFAQYKKSEQDIAEVVGKGLANIKEKCERIKISDIHLLPEKWLNKND